MNRERLRTYADALRDIPGLTVVSHDAAERSNFQYVVVEVDADRFGIDRDQLVRLLHAERVLARRYFYPGCHAMEPYRTRDPLAGRHLPHTERLCARVMTLPNGTSVELRDIAAIASLLRFCAANAAAIRARLSEPVAGGASR